MSVVEFDYEPIRGLPGYLPPGESILWQGSPQWWPLARRALRVVPIAMYFCGIAAWQAMSAFASQHRWLSVAHAVRIPLLLGAIALVILLLVAWGAARATVYTITTRRIVIRHGIALPMSLNLPFSRIQSAAVRTFGDGSGELVLRLQKTQRIGYLLNWPHVRAGHYLQPQACLRALADANLAAEVLSGALQASVRDSVTSPQIGPAHSLLPATPPAQPSRTSVAA
jgi:hypothetical protein